LGALVAAAMLLSACTAGSGGTVTQPPAPAQPVPPLEVRLAKVAAVALKGRPSKEPLLAPAEQIRQTMTAMYSAGFLDPGQWASGYPTVLDAFAQNIRGEAQSDLNRLTLGPSTRDLHSVQPVDAQIVVRFLRNDHGNPVAAIADMQFQGIGYGEGIEVPIRHGGEYEMRPVNGTWLVTGYEVRGHVGPASYRPGVPGGDPLFVLAIGSDARPRKPVTRALADSLHIIGVNPRTGAASILGIPRDSYVTVPGVGTRKINASLFHGGPELVVKAVERLTRIRIDAYLLTGFEDFRRMVSDVGGIEMTIPQAMSDSYSGARFRPGPTRLDGPKALAFSRNRHDVRGGDVGRSLNQGRLLIAALRELREDVRKDPLAIFSWILVGAKYLQTDLSFLEMVDLMFAALTVDKVKNRVVSGGGGFAGGASVIRLGSTAQRMFRDLRRDGTL
jgi:polyisoprenyl-teichoic acid--peptidoglycan teichoic acid transferase